MSLSALETRLSLFQRFTLVDSLCVFHLISHTTYKCVILQFQTTLQANCRTPCQSGFLLSFGTQQVFIFRSCLSGCMFNPPSAYRLFNVNYLHWGCVDSLQSAIHSCPANSIDDTSICLTSAFPCSSVRAFKNPRQGFIIELAPGLQNLLLVFAHFEAGVSESSSQCDKKNSSRKAHAGGGAFTALTAPTSTYYECISQPITAWLWG